MNRKYGITLIELMIVLFIIAMMTFATLAIFKNFREATSVKVAVRDVASIMRLARRKAITEREDYLAVYDLKNEKVWTQSYSSYGSYGIRPDFGTEQSLPDRAIIARVTGSAEGRTGVGTPSKTTDDYVESGYLIGYHKFSPRSTVTAGSVWLKDEKLENFYSVSLISPTARARIWGPKDRFYD